MKRLKIILLVMMILPFVFWSCQDKTIFRDELIYEDTLKIVFWIFMQIILPMVISAVMIFFFQDWLKTLKESITAKPYVAVLISEYKRQTFQIPKDFLDGFNSVESEKYFQDIKNNHIQIKHFDDELDGAKSDAIIDKLIKDTNCIMIIANANSTLTKKNLDKLLTSEKKVPFIMPIATDYDIIEKATASNFNGILRILPDNSRQTDCFVDFIVEKVKPEPNKPIIIFRDFDNQTYSENFSEDIRTKLSKKKIQSTQYHIGGGNNINFSELGSPSAMIYVGISDNAKFLIDHLHFNNISVPLILTDGCLVSSVFQHVSEKYAGNSYILSPIKLDKNAKYEDIDYKLIGKNTYKICKTIFKNCYGKREKVYEYIEHNKKRIKIDNYEFDSDGNNTLGRYTIYRIEGGSLKIE